MDFEFDWNKRSAATAAKGTIPRRLGSGARTPNGRAVALPCFKLVKRLEFKYL
jgi:hypothetical protein